MKWLNPITGTLHYPDGHREFVEGGEIDGVNSWAQGQTESAATAGDGDDIDDMDSIENADKKKEFEALKKESQKFQAKLAADERKK